MMIRNRRALKTGERHAAPRTIDETRVRTMLDEHFDAVYHGLRRSGVPTGDLEDCTQEVFLIASSKLEVILEGRERAFLLGVALRVAAHARRRLRRFPFLWSEEPDVESWEDPRLRPDEEMDIRIRRALFGQVMRKMPEDLKHVFLLFEIEELTMVEIASALDLPVGTVASRLRRAREEFVRLASRMVASEKGGQHAR